MKRLDFLDNARGFAMLSILILHIFSRNYFTIWISSFVVALFFILSGCVNKLKNVMSMNLKSIIYNRIKALMIPYFIFCFINIGVQILFSGGITEEIKANVIFTFNLYGVGALWFIPALFVSEIMFIVINKYFNKYFKVIAILFLFFIGLFGTTVYYNKSIFIIYRSCIGIGFIAFGYKIFDYIKNEKLNNIMIIILLSLSFIISTFNGIIDIWSLWFNNIIIFIPCALIGSMGVIYLFKKNSVPLLSYWGINSLIVMSTHQILIELMIKIGIDNNFLKFGFIIMLEILIIYIINNYFPYILGKKTKKGNVELEVV